MERLKNNYVSDGGIKKKISKYKSFSSNPNLINPSAINVLRNNNNKIEKAENNNNRIEKEPKTTRNINKKLFVNKKIKSSKSQEKITKNETKLIKKSIEKTKNKEKINIDYHKKQSHSQGHFNRKRKIFQNNDISKNIKEIKPNTNRNSKNCDINDNIKNNNSKNIKINKINIKIKKENKNKENKNKEKKEKKENEDSKKIIEQKQRKNEYIDSLIKNGVLNITKELNFIKKLTPKDILNKKKEDFLKENGFTEINIDNNDKIIQQSQINLNNINIKSIRKKNISTKSSNVITNKTKNKLNLSKSNSRYISVLNNKINTNINKTNNLDTQISNRNYKKITLKPQINQFEFINKIQLEQKKLPNHKKVFTPRGIESHLKFNDFEQQLSDSFRHSNSKKSKINIHNNTDIDIKINNINRINKNKDINDINTNKNNIKKENDGINLKQKINNKDITDINNNKKLFDEIDEFPFSHKKSYRSQFEIYKYLKEKKIETKKEEENTEKEKKLKAYITFQNLINIGKKPNNITKLSTNLNSNRNRKEAKGHMKLRKEPNEYYIGTESSKNNSTFIDKNEYYLSILESQKFVNKSKILKKEEDKIKETDNNKDNKNNIANKKLVRGLSTELFDNKKIIDKLFITINKANQIFSKDNLNKFKNNLLKISTEINNTQKKPINNIILSKEDDNNKKENKIFEYNNKNNINKKTIKTPELKIDIPNTTHSTYNIYSKNSLNNNSNEINSKNQKNNVSNFSISNNNLSGANSQEKISSDTFSKSLNPIKNIKRIDQKIIINLVNIINSIQKRKIFTFLYKMYFDNYKKKTYTIGFNYLTVICKIYSFKKIQEYSRNLELYEAFMELFKPFIRNRFKKFVKYYLEIKIRNFVWIIELFYKYKAMNKLFTYCERDFKKEIINFLIFTIKKPLKAYFFKKLLLYKIKSSNININKEKYPFNQNEKMLYEQIDITYNNSNDTNKNYSIDQKANKSVELNKDVKNNEAIENNSCLNINGLLNAEFKDNFGILSEIKDPIKLTDELANIIIEKIIETEIKPFSPLEKMIPYKSFKYDIIPKSQNNSLNNSYISSSCASLDQLSINNNNNINNNSINDSRIQSLNDSLISQMSYNSEFNKTIKDKKREQAMSFYVKKIAPKLIKIICDEIKLNYNRIYENISTPLKTDFEEIIIALELKDNEQLKQNYRVLEVKEEINDIINREKIIKKFGIINKKIRKKYNQNIDELFDIFLNLNLIDTAIEIINKERIYGEVGEPFSFYSKRNREIGFKYKKNEPKKLVKLIYKLLMEYINNPIFLIKDSVINADENKIVNYFKKDLEENECQWEDLEIVETQSKLEVTEIILDQLYNEVIEILEHVQLSRKSGDLYQEKSIYACKDIPKLNFQLTTTENEFIQEGEVNDILDYK